MAEYMNDSKIKEFSSLFACFDYHSRGTITASALLDILVAMQLKVNLEDVIQLIKETGNKS